MVSLTSPFRGRIVLNRLLVLLCVRFNALDTSPDFTRFSVDRQTQKFRRTQILNDVNLCSCFPKTSCTFCVPPRRSTRNRQSVHCCAEFLRCLISANPDRSRLAWPTLRASNSQHATQAPLDTLKTQEYSVSAAFCGTDSLTQQDEGSVACSSSPHHVSHTITNATSPECEAFRARTAECVGKFSVVSALPPPAS